jgi:hypothetical protein
VKSRRAAVARSLLIAAACACFGARAATQEVPLQIEPGPKPPDARAIADYAGAVHAIVWVMVHRFGLPMPRGTLEVHSTREGFERALVRKLRISPSLARSTAEFAKSAVGSNTVLVNAPAISAAGWPERTELLAHEITHAVELTLANRPALARPQWLIEGFAEWMAYAVTDALGLDNLDAVRTRVTARLREQRRAGDLPRLLRIVSLADWVDARKRYGFDRTYSLAFVATDFLIARRSLAAVTDYFRRFERVDDADANFAPAFGEDIAAFESALQRHLDALLR